ncbi:MAG: hypothetical protein JWP12_1721 [Bacteroidetes bacterium]|nr:hypothetical protein [Bacteroidota bacterium]
MKKQLLPFFIFIIAGMLPIASKAQSSRGCVLTYTQSLTVCFGDNIIVGTHTYNTSSTYSDTLTAVSGCDSIVTTNLTVRAPIQTTQGFAPCSMSVHITVGTHVHTTNGFYHDTLVAASGCDSIVHTHLQYYISSLYHDQYISICPGDSFAVGNHFYSTNGAHIDTLATFRYGCDSLVTTHIDVLGSTLIDAFQNISTCSCGIYGSSTHYYAQNISYQWIDCNNGFAAVPGDTLPDVVPTVGNVTYNYAVVVSLNGCADTSDCVPVILLGINEQNAAVNELTAYPNPASDNITLEFYTTAEQPLNISIVNVLGASVYGSDETYPVGANKLLIPVNGISNGVYMVKISDGNSAVVKRVVVNH